jgi:signal transduction histidine kinase
MPRPLDENPVPGDRPVAGGLRPAGGLLAGMRIRKKLIVLHTLFSLVLAAILWLALQPAVRQVVEKAEEHEARATLQLLLAAGVLNGDEASLRKLVDAVSPDVVVRWGTAEQLAIPTEVESILRSGDDPIGFIDADGRPSAAVVLAGGGYLATSVRQGTSRDAVARLYILLTAALLAVYGLVAAALEIFVLPRHVYRPIRAILDADHAVAEGQRDIELVPDEAMPSDELGEIMRSRNRSITALRRHEADLAEALQRIEEVATDLRRKNHLLETARQNLADADRLASLGMMSAGLAHELNTPLAVIKGLAEKLNIEVAPGNDRRSLSAVEAALLLRVVGRLERLSESLLDFARARPPTSRLTPLRPLIDEAATMVRLDRDAFPATIANHVSDDVSAWCDGDRIVQVLVNLLRNAIDAAGGSGGGAGSRGSSGRTATIEVAAEEAVRDGRRWVSLTIADDGPGIDPEVMPRLFQPFATTRLDSRGTGLGLATAEGIIREHGGVLLARNKLHIDGRIAGAVFEIVLPAEGC